MLDMLSEDERYCLELRFVMGLTFRDIGGKLRVSHESARARVMAALGKLRAALGDDAAA